MSEQNINIEITQTQPSTITTEQYKLLSGVVGGGLPFLFDIDPGNFTAPLDGTFVLNNVNPLTATKIAISYNTKDGVDCSEWIKLVTSSGRLFINRYSDPVCYAAFSISNITDKTTWIEFDISNLVLLGWTKLQDQNTCYITLLSGADSGNTLIGYTGVADHLNFLGDRAGDNSDGSGDSNFIGTAAGEGAKRSINCNYFGDEAGRFLEDGYDCIGIGDAAFWGSLGIEGSVALGNFIAGLCDNINYSVFIGRYAAANAFFAEKAVFIGEHAGENARNAAKAIFIGYNAGNQIADYDVNNRQIDVKYISPKIRFNGCYPNNPGNLNDLHLGTSEYSGVYPEVIYTITIYTVGDIDTFVWADNQGNSYDPDISGLLYITGEDQLIAEGVYIKFNNLTGHMVSDQWVIKAFDAHMEGGAPICIGIDSSSGGFLGSIVMGENAVNTKALQFLIGSQYKYIQLRGVDYELPSTLGNVGDVLKIDDVSGKLIWAAGGSASGGHTIQDNGSVKPTESNLNFKGFNISDDPTNHATIIEHIPTDISGKVDKVTGKGLSTNDLTDVLKNAYDGAVSLEHAAHSDDETATTIAAIIGGTTNQTLQDTDEFCFNRP